TVQPAEPMVPQHANQFRGAMPNQQSPPLLPQHATLLTASGITPAIIRMRGYRTITSLAELQRLGFGRNQGNVPALVIPVYGLDGNVRQYQIRPDTPRINRD